MQVFKTENDEKISLFEIIIGVYRIDMPFFRLHFYVNFNRKKNLRLNKRHKKVIKITEILNKCEFLTKVRIVDNKKGSK